MASEDAEAPKDRFSRPAAPNFDLLSETVDEDDAEDDDEALTEALDEAEAPAVEPSVPSARVSAYSRPPAPMLDFGAEEEEDAPESSPADPNATTLISEEGPRPSRPPSSRISVEVAADADEDEIPVSDGPVSEAASGDAEQVSSSLGGEFFRAQDSTLAPVVDEAAALDDDDDPIEPVFVSPQEAARRRKLRRIVGIGVIAAGLATIGLVASSSMSEDAATAAPAAAKLNSPKEKVEKKKTPAAPIAEETAKADEPAAEVEEETIGADLPDDVETLEKETLALLNDRKFEEAIPFAEKLISLKPESAYGYRCLGSALQDLGRYNEAQKVYSDCATNATKGEYLECTALGGANRKMLEKQKAEQAAAAKKSDK